MRMQFLGLVLVSTSSADVLFLLCNCHSSETSLMINSWSTKSLFVRFALTNKFLSRFCAFEAAAFCLSIIEDDSRIQDSSSMSWWMMLSDFYCLLHSLDLTGVKTHSDQLCDLQIRNNIVSLIFENYGDSVSYIQFWYILNNLAIKLYLKCVLCQVVK